jgi:predicted RNA methylase
LSRARAIAIEPSIEVAAAIVVDAFLRDEIIAWVVDTCVGAPSLAIATVRRGTSFPPFLDARRAADKALVVVM